MINLIPPAGHAAVKKEYWMRVSATYCFLFASVALILTIALIPTYVLVDAQMTEFSETGVTTSAGREIEDAGGEVAQMSAIIDELKRIPGNDPLSSVIQDIQNSASAGVTFRSISVRYENNAIAPIQIQGVASRREDLVALKQAIESNPRFGTVSVPISDLARDRDVPFSVTIELAASS
jgi:hypothetical protein